MCVSVGEYIYICIYSGPDHCIPGAISTLTSTFWFLNTIKVTRADTRAETSIEKNHNIRLYQYLEM